jgi:arylformamidase
MRYLDISIPIQPGMMVYKNKPEKQPVFAVSNQLAQGGSYETTLTMNVHTGTHIDFPLHMQAGGQTSTSFDLSRLMTPVRVIDCGQVQVINEALLKTFSLKRGDFVLFKTRNSAHADFLDDFTYLDGSGAAYCVQLGLKGVGIDALGIERQQPAHVTHHTLMDAGIIILEGLRLADVQPGTYPMIALPLSIPHLDALPVRALLVVNE